MAAGGGRGRLLAAIWMDGDAVLPVAKARVVLMAPGRVKTVRLTRTCRATTAHFFSSFSDNNIKSTDDVSIARYIAVLNHNRTSRLIHESHSHVIQSNTPLYKDVL